jgi:hypothetical protein
MKKPITFLMLTAFALSARAQAPDLPVTFDNSAITYTLTDFGGNASQVANDPVNASNKVAEVTKTNSAQTWAGTTIGPATGLASKIPFSSTSTKITVKVYSPDSGIVVRLKAEDPNDPTRSVETDARTTKKNTWETLEFDFSNQATGTAAINFSYTYQKISIFFNFGIDGATAGAKTYYCDDIEMAAGTKAQIDLPVTFESSSVDYTMIDFGGNSYSIVADPTSSSNTVAQVVKSNTAETWAGTTIGTNSGFAAKIPFTANTPKMTMRVYSPDSGIVVRLKAEDPANPGISVETDAKTTKKNTWETLEFDFSNQATGTAAINYSNTYQKLSAFFNFGVDGATAGTKTYYFDDVKMGESLLKQIDLPITFDATNVDYTMIDFGGNVSSIANDPVNSSNKVGKAVKTSGAELWAGTTCGTNAGFANAIPFAVGKNLITLKVYSPDSGILVKLKAEDATNPSISVETDVRTRTKNTWEWLTFDFSNQSAGTAAINYSNTYKKLSIFFNFGITGATAGEKTYFFDSVYFGGNAAAEKVRVTFRVDARNVTLATGESLTLNGTFNGWCGNCAPMTKESGSDIWSLTVLLDTAKEYEFKYVVGNWVKDEKLTPGMACVKTTDNFTNRVMMTGKTDDTMELVCWESCGPCGATNVNNFSTSGLRLYPNPANTWVAVAGETENGRIGEISISDITGRVVFHSRLAQSAKEISLPLDQLKAGSYVVTAIFDNQQIQTARLQVQ